MTLEQFKSKYNQVKEIVKGHGREIARESGLSYTTCFNVIRGLVTDLAKIEAAWIAIRAKVDQLISQVPGL